MYERRLSRSDLPSRPDHLVSVQAGKIQTCVRRGTRAPPEGQSAVNLGWRPMKDPEQICHPCFSTALGALET